MGAKKSDPKLDAKKLAPKVIKLARLAFEFAETYRVTQLPSGNLESDTDHTFALSLIACAVAAEYEPKLDVGKVAQYALVHDLVEVHAKDTPTVILSDDELKAKYQREADALARIKKDFGKDFPWIYQTIEAYEKLADPEARFVKVMDKALPAITHLFNNGAYLRSIGINDASSRQLSLANLTKRLKKQVADQDLAYALREALEAESSKLFE